MSGQFSIFQRTKESLGMQVSDMTTLVSHLVNCKSLGYINGRAFIQNKDFG